MIDPESSLRACADELMQAYAGPAPGACVLVLHDSKPLIRCAYGFADLENHIPAAPDVNFRLASVTKQFTAAAILLLVENGCVSLDDQVHRWMPGLPATLERITVRQLLSHTSGLIDYEDVIPPEMTAQLRDADVLSILESQPRTYFLPGEGYRYSNSGYALLALIVERASGQSFPTFLREWIFAPLGMHGTVAHVEGVTNVPRRAYGYSRIDGRWVRTDQSQTSAVLGDGGVYSSIDDLAKWDAALCDERLLSAESLRLAFTPVTQTGDPAVQYACGWRVTGESVWHSGETIGFRNVIVRYPLRRTTIIILTNREGPEPYPIALKLSERLAASSAR